MQEAEPLLRVLIAPGQSSDFTPGQVWSLLASFEEFSCCLQTPKMIREYRRSVLLVPFHMTFQKSLEPPVYFAFYSVWCFLCVLRAAESLPPYALQLGNSSSSDY